MIIRKGTFHLVLALAACTTVNGYDTICEENGDAQFLDKHTIVCPADTALTQWSGSKDGCDDSSKPIKIHYECSALPADSSKEADSISHNDTGCNELNDNNLEFLDRHELTCPSEYVMQGWMRLSSDVFKYTCVRLGPVGSENISRERKSDCNEIQGKDIEYLERHDLRCPAGSFMSKWRLSPDDCVAGHQRFIYECLSDSHDAFADHSTMCEPNGDLEFLGRHTMTCPDGTAMAAFRGHNCGGDPWEFRMNYYCRGMPGDTANVFLGDTGCDEVDVRRLEYMDRHHPKCPDGKVMTEWKLSKDGCETGKQSFKYKCVDQGTTHQVCKTLSTSCNNVVNEEIVFLDRHPVTCPEGSWLKAWKMDKADCTGDSSHMKFVYDCCDDNGHAFKPDTLPPWEINLKNEHYLELVKKASDMCTFLTYNPYNDVQLHACELSRLTSAMNRTAMCGSSIDSLPEVLNDPLWAEPQDNPTFEKPYRKDYWKSWSTKTKSLMEEEHMRKTIANATIYTINEAADEATTSFVKTEEGFCMVTFLGTQYNVMSYPSHPFKGHNTFITDWLQNFNSIRFRHEGCDHHLPYVGGWNNEFTIELLTQLKGCIEEAEVDGCTLGDLHYTGVDCVIITGQSQGAGIAASFAHAVAQGISEKPPVTKGLSDQKIKNICDAAFPVDEKIKFEDGFLMAFKFLASLMSANVIDESYYFQDDVLGFWPTWEAQYRDYCYDMVRYMSDDRIMGRPSLTELQDLAFPKIPNPFTILLSCPRVTLSANCNATMQGMNRIHRFSTRSSRKGLNLLQIWDAEGPQLFENWGSKWFQDFFSQTPEWVATNILGLDKARDLFITDQIDYDPVSTLISYIDFGPVGKIFFGGERDGDECGAHFDGKSMTDMANDNRHYGYHTLFDATTDNVKSERGKDSQEPLSEMKSGLWVGKFGMYWEKMVMVLPGETMTENSAIAPVFPFFTRGWERAAEVTGVEEMAGMSTIFTDLCNFDFISAIANGNDECQQYVGQRGIDIGRGALNLHSLNGIYGYKNAIDRIYHHSVGSSCGDKKPELETGGFPTYALCETDDDCASDNDYCVNPQMGFGGPEAQFFNLVADALKELKFPILNAMLGKNCMPKKELGKECHRDIECQSNLCLGNNWNEFFDEWVGTELVAGICSNCQFQNSNDVCPEGQFCRNAPIWEDLDMGLECHPKYEFGQLCEEHNDECADGYCSWIGLLRWCSRCPEQYSGTGCPGHQYCDEPWTDDKIGLTCVNKKNTGEWGCVPGKGDMCTGGLCNLFGFCQDY